MRRAKLWTDGATVAGADALAIAYGRIVALGREAELAGFVGPSTRVWDAAGASVTPGLVDAHLHLIQWARSLSEVDLFGAASPAEVVARVAAFMAVTPGDAPIVGRGFDPNAWSTAPERAALDALGLTRPVLLHSKDFHALWVNGAALRACGITRDTPDPSGGRIVRDGAGEATGLLMEHAVRLCARLLPAGHAGDAAAVRRALPQLHARGVTGVHDFEGREASRVLREVCAAEPTPLRVLMHLAHSGLDAAIDLGLTSGVGDDVFRIGAVKLFADGTLGSRTAAMLEPYENGDETGMDLMSPAELRDTVERASDAGISIAIHAIGDRAVRSCLDAFEAAGPALSRLALPPRIEHLQLVDPGDMPRLARLGVAASMQPSHALTDARLAAEQWGARVAYSYPWRALLDCGALLAFGSDAPVEPPDAPLGLCAAVTRQGPGLDAPFTPHQRVSLDAALSAYTQGAARLAGTWPRVGTLRPGAAADVVVWSRDLHSADPLELAQTTPAATILAGEVLWSATGGPAS